MNGLNPRQQSVQELNRLPVNQQALRLLGQEQDRKGPERVRILDDRLYSLQLLRYALNERNLQLPLPVDQERLQDGLLYLERGHDQDAARVLELAEFPLDPKAGLVQLAQDLAEQLVGALVENDALLP